MTLKLIKNFLFTLLILGSLSCKDQDDAPNNPWPEEVTRGLSGVSPKDFKDDQGLLFFFPELGSRSFWMPDTYFDLDIIFLDKDLKVLDIVRDVPHHPGFQEPIPRVKTVQAWHVLEMKAGSSHAQEIKIGQKLSWKPNWKKTSNYLLRFFGK